jgi:hypothetical protein
MPLGAHNSRAAATGLLDVTRGHDLPYRQGRRSTLNGPPLNMAVVSDNAIRTTSSYKTQDEAYINDTYR